MFFVITERLYKVGTGSKEKFAARSTNRTEWTVSGPFSKQTLAERVAASALGTHTCLTAQVTTRVGLQEILTRWNEFPNDLHKAAQRALKLAPELPQ